MPRTLNLILCAAGAAALLCAAVPLAWAGTLENLERERAILIDTALDPKLAPAEREARLQTSSRRLVDLERMVLRDDELVGRNTPMVRKAFANYDLTFMVHAAVEKDLSVLDLWLEQVGVSTDSLLAARPGRR